MTSTRNNVQKKKRFGNNTKFGLVMGTFDFLTQSKRYENGGINFGFSAGKEIKLIVRIKKDTITFVRKVEDIKEGRQREPYGLRQTT